MFSWLQNQICAVAGDLWVVVCLTRLICSLSWPNCVNRSMFLRSQPPHIYRPIRFSGAANLTMYSFYVFIDFAAQSTAQSSRCVLCVPVPNWSTHSSHICASRIFSQSAHSTLYGIRNHTFYIYIYTIYTIRADSALSDAIRNPCGRAPSGRWR